jgi:hypothetical protein
MDPIQIFALVMEFIAVLGLIALASAAPVLACYFMSRRSRQIPDEELGQGGAAGVPRRLEDIAFARVYDGWMAGKIKIRKGQVPPSTIAQLINTSKEKNTR